MAITIPIVTTWNGAGLKKAQRELGKAQTGIEKVGAVGRGMQSMGRAMTMGLTLPIVGLAAASTKTAATFESTMKQIGTISGATGAELESSMKAARDEINRMGTETIYSSQDAADAFLELQKAGIDTQSVIEGGLAAAMNLAATEGLDLAYASEITAKAMNAFSIPAEEAGKVADILANAAMNSAAKVEDLAYGLKYVSPTAAAMGISLEETASSLAILNNAGLDASTAGTSLNQMMVALLSPTKKASAAMDAIGFSMTDAEGNMKSMPEIIRDLEGSLEGLSDKEKQAALKDMFNTRGMRAANILLKEGSDGFEDMAGKIDEAGGAAKMADARMSGMAGVMEKLRGSAETAGIAFGNAIAPAIEFVATALDKLLDWFTKLSPGMQTAITVILLLVAALGPVILFIGALISALTVIIPIVSTVAMSIGMIVVILNWWIIVIALVIAAIVAFVVMIVKNWDKITATIKQFIDWFKTSFPELWAFISGVVKVAMAWILGYIKMVWNTIVNVFKFVFKVIWGIVSTTFKLIWNIVQTVFKTIFTIINGVLKAIKALFKGDFGAMWDIVKETLGKIWDIFKAFPKRILEALGDLGSTLFNAGKELIGGLIDGIKSMFNSVKDAVASVIPGGNSATVEMALRSGRGVAYYGVAPRGKAAKAATTIGNVTIVVNEAPDSVLAARRIKRALENYDIAQGRSPAQTLARAW